MSNDFKLMLIQIFIIIVLIVVIIYLIRQNVAIKFERRIGRYSIEPLKMKMFLYWMVLIKN